ncbi:N-acetylmuramoyl-L-alanine amidase [Geodermatophilus sp. SYSU D00698]
MRRLAVGSLAFVASLATITVLPVYASPSPGAVPVETDSVEVDLGSVAEPAPAVDVQEGTTAPVAGVSDTAPTLSVTRTGVPSFSLVGVTWAPDAAVTDVRVQVRVQNEDGDWGSWTEIGPEDAEQDAGTVAAEARGGTAPLWTGPSTGVEVELVTRSGAAPTDVQLDLIDPNSSAADTSLGTPDIQDAADAAMAMPAVYSRAQWGADESIRTWDPEYAPTIKAATVHHTADTNNYSAADVPAMMRSIYRYHTVSRGWGDIGYNVIVDKYGRLWEGRSGGLASTVVGAHAGGFNTGTFGVSMLGNYDTISAPQTMVDSVAAIIAWKFSLYGVNSRGTTTLTSGGGGTSRYAAGVPVTLPTVFGHRDVGSTSCPGQYGYARLPEIRDRVAGLLAASTTPEITQRYDSDATLRALLGAKTGPEQVAAGVTWQTYQGGSLYYSPGVGVKLVRGGVLAAYLRAGGPSSLGAPTVEERGVSDGRGVVAEFQRGAIYWTATTNAHVIRGGIRDHWLSLGGPAGPLGYPVDDERGMPDGSGARSAFEGGSVYWSPATGPVVTGGGIRAAYENSGGPSGVLGYPTESESEVSGGRGRVQRFQRGAVYWTSAAYGAIVFGGIGSAWNATGGPDGPMGLPTGNERSAADGVGSVQTFQRGSVYWSPATGAYPVRGGMLGAWLASGGETGPNGYPTSAESEAGDGRGQVQRFQRGSVYWTATVGAYVVRGAVGGIWLASGGPGGPLGYPTATERTTPNGSGQMQTFERGTVYWSGTTGARIVRGDIADAYEAFGGVTGLLGLPTAEAVVTGPDGTGRVQTFQNGSIYWTSANGAHVVFGAIRSTWSASGGVTGPLGFPVADERTLRDGRGQVQEFEHGEVYWSAATGARIVRGDIGDAYAAAGGATGVMGLPTAEATATGSGGTGRVQTFQGGSIYWTAGAGAHVVRGGIGAAWLVAGGVNSRLGFPTTDEAATATGAEQRFQGGSITWTASTGRTAVTYR